MVWALGYLIFGFIAPRFAGGRSSVPRVSGVTASLVALAFVLASGAPASAAALDQVKARGKIRLGYRADARPLSFEDESGHPAGYSVALCQHIVAAARAELGLATLDVEWVPVTIASRFDVLKQGEIDLLCGAETATLARRSDVSFSIPVFPGGMGALVRADAPARLKEALSGRAG